MGLFSAKVPTKSMVPMCRQLATVYQAGIPIVRGLTLASKNARDKRSRQILQEMADSVQQGSTLAGAAKHHAKYLPPFFIELLRAGEQGGRLDVMLNDLAAYYEDRMRMQRQIMAGLAYPALQVTMAWFLGTFALGLVSKIDFGSQTRFDLMAYITSYLYFQAGAMVALTVGILICAALSRMGVFGWIYGWFTNRVWPINIVTRKFALARFFRSLALLIGSGMHIIPCIKSAAATTANPYIERELLRALPFVSEGSTLVEAFAPVRIMTPTAREMLHVGEQSGNLDGALMKVSEYHLAEANQAVKVASTVMGVLILVGIAALVGALIITFYSRLYGGMLDSIT
jgi:type IV pilus assembly protein PilC